MGGNAMDEAQRLHESIVELARRHDYRALYEIAEDPKTRPRLDVLPKDTRARSLLHIDAAHRWARRQTAANQRRLDEASSALDAFDIELASGLLSRIDDAFLGEDDGARRDELLLALSARRLEIEEVTGAIDDAVSPIPRRRRWWRR